MPNIIAAIKGAASNLKSWAFSTNASNMTVGGTGMLTRARFMGDMVHRSSIVVGSRGKEYYENKVGDPLANASLSSILGWVVRNFPEALPIVRDLATGEYLPDHPVAALMREPNQYQSYSTTSAGVVVPYIVNGNGYQFKVRNAQGKVIALWSRPPWMVEPYRAPGSPNFIDGYWYKPDAATPAKLLPISEVIHYRNGQDPENELKGKSDVKNIMLQLFTDSEINRYMAAMLNNLGVPGAVYIHEPQPWGDEGELVHLSDSQVKQLEERHTATFSGDGQGKPLVLDGKFNVVFPDGKIDAAFIEKAKGLSQADICSAIGLPPVVVLFQIGIVNMDQRAGHEQARLQAYRECLGPIQRNMAQDATRCLLRTEYPGSPSTHVVGYDYREVPSLQADRIALTRMLSGLYYRGGIQRSELRRGLGWKATSSDNIYYTDIMQQMRGSPEPAGGGDNVL